MNNVPFNSAFFGLYENVFHTASQIQGEEFALSFMRKLFSNALGKSYAAAGFEKGDPNSFSRVVGLRDESVGLRVAFPEISNTKIIYRFLDDPFPGLKGLVDPKALGDTYISFKVNFLLGDEWKFELTKHLWFGAPFTEYVITRQ